MATFGPLVSGVWGTGEQRWSPQPPGCREAGARVSTNVFVRDLDLAVTNQIDNVSLMCCSCFGGALSPCLGVAHRREREMSVRRDGVVLVEARRRKERMYPELVGDAGRARLVVLAPKVGGRWSAETLRFQAVCQREVKVSSCLLRGKARASWVPPASISSRKDPRPGWGDSRYA